MGRREQTVERTPSEEEQAVVEAQGVKNTLDGEIISLSETKKNLQNNIIHDEETLSNLQNDLEKIKLDIEKYQNEASVSRISANEVNNKLNELLVLRDDYEKDLVEFKLKCNSEKEALVTELNEKRESLILEIQGYTKNIGDLLVDLKSAEKNVNELNEKGNLIKKDIEQSVVSLGSLTKEIIKNQDIVALANSDIEQKNNVISQLNNTISELKETKTGLENDLIKIQDEVKKQNETLDAAKNDYVEKMYTLDITEKRVEQKTIQLKEMIKKAQSDKQIADFMI